MIRPVFTELALFLAPFAAYGLFLWATRAGVFDSAAWSVSRLAWLTVAALALMIGSFVMLAQYSAGPAGSTYVPAHVENGRFVPGSTK